MSTFITDFDNEEHDKWLEVEIDYTCYDSERGSIDGGRLTYEVPGSIEIHTVTVLRVEYYSPDGEIMCRIERDRMHPEVMKLLDIEAALFVDREVDEGGCLADDLWNAR